MAVDPVCGMNVDATEAKHTARHDGRTFYFCSAGCLDKFSREPEKYAPAHVHHGPAATPAARKSGDDRRTYTCPMHPEVRQVGPGSCPKCGMALEPVNAAPAVSRTQYVCPMHPQIIRDEPGNCPICGMALEPRVVTVADERNPELDDMTRRLWVAAGFTVPLVVLAMGHMVPGNPLAHLGSPRVMAWAELLLCTPVVVWSGWPLLVRGWHSVVNRSLHIFTLNATGSS
jgi:Cu+-exporting ATPase